MNTTWIKREAQEPTESDFPCVLYFGLAMESCRGPSIATHNFNPSFTHWMKLPPVPPEPPKPREWDLRGWHVYEVGGAGSINALADVGNDPIRVREILQ